VLTKQPGEEGKMGRVHVTTSNDVVVQGAEVTPGPTEATDLRELATTECPQPQEGAENPNVLLIVVDDAWAGEYGVYSLDPGQNEATTPNLNRLAAAGVVFERAYSKPLCSPSRGALNTGRYGFHTGLGQLAGESMGQPLSLSEKLLPRLLCSRGYASACIGKWHLAGLANGNERHPIFAGYQFWQGSLRNFTGTEDHYSWDRTTSRPDPTAEDGVEVVEEHIDTWAAEQTVDDALAWIGAQTRPWFCNLNFNSAHTPNQGPPAGTFDEDAHPTVVPGTLDGTRIERFKAMVENVDHEVGRLLLAIQPAVLAQTHVVFLTDNGSDLVQRPWPNTHVKRTCYEPGIHVPLVWTGPGVNGGGRRYPHWIQLEDVFTTIAELTGVDLTGTWASLDLDGISFVEALTSADPGELRTTCYTEAFAPNTPNQGATHGGIRCVQVLHTDGKRYKLMRFVPGTTADATDEMYCLTDDPVEVTNLTPNGSTAGLTPEQSSAYTRLWSDFVATVNS
jgi:arylsulfatase A-like enzyme